MNALSFPADSVLPWHSGVVEDKRFKWLLVNGLGVFLTMAVLFPFLPAPVIEKTDREKERTEYTRLIIEEKPLPLPPKVENKPIPVVKKPVKAKPKPVPKVEQPKPKKVKPKTKPVDLMKQARDKAAKTGVLAFADDLASMRQQVDVSKVKRSNLTRGAAQAEKTERKLLASKAKAAVGGINTAALSRDTGGVALSARETTRIDAPTGIATGDATQAAATDIVDYSGRSSEAVRRVMDANKGAIFAVYNRALRKDPTLAGKVLFKMVIEPSGKITSLSLLSSELADTALVKKILSRIRLINFGADAVETTEVNYSFDFLPY